MYLINDQQPGPLIEADEGDDLEIFVQNDLPVETTIHWHGRSLYRIPLEGWLAVYAVQQKTDMITLGLLQRGTPDMDGVPGVTQVGWRFISLCHAYACLVSNPASR